MDNKSIFKKGSIPDFGKEVLIFKNGEIKINDLTEDEKFKYSILKTEEKKKIFIEEKAKEMTAKTAAEIFINHCKNYGLTLREMGLALQYLDYEHQSLVEKALEKTIIQGL